MGIAETTEQRWLARRWPFVQEHLPSTPARVLEIGCGPLGGFVPYLRSRGYLAVGVDPQAPQGPGYHQIEFEQLEMAEPVDAAIACTSLHHVDDLDHVLDRVAEILRPEGVFVVVEWAYERFDHATAQWCFDRLTPDGEGWLNRHRDQWIASAQTWDSYFTAWSAQERLHPGRDIVQALRTRFHTRLIDHGPYFFGDLDGTTATDEQAAIDAGHIQANGIRYVATA